MTLPRSKAARMAAVQDLIAAGLLVPVVYSRWVDWLAKIVVPGKYRAKRAALEKELALKLLIHPTWRA